MSCITGIVHCTPYPVQAIAYNHYSPLAKFYFPKEGDFSFDEPPSICRMVVFYPIGMIGFALQTIIRAIQLVGDILGLLCACGYYGDQGVLILDTFVSLLISVVGIAAPPLAYKLDDLARERFEAMMSQTAKDDAIFVT